MAPRLMYRGTAVRTVLATVAKEAGEIPGSAASVSGHIWRRSDSVNRLFAILFRGVANLWKTPMERPGFARKRLPNASFTPW